jgi:transaldolase
MTTSPILQQQRRYKSPLFEMTQTTPTCLWNDSAALDELQYSLEHGGVGATCNPVIVLDVLKKEANLWNDRIRAIAKETPTFTEEQVAWRLVEEISTARSALLLSIFREQKGRNGRLSIQTDPRLYRDAAAMTSQAVRFSKLAPNMIVKIAVTEAGVKAIEEATCQGVSINATVCFSLPQCVAVAEAVERGLTRREMEGKEISSISPVCTIMVGRLDDWLKVAAEKHQITIEPGHLEWAGVAVFKKTYKLFRERKYRIRLLSAAFRNHMHWSALIGGDVVISPPHKWQVRFNASDIKVEPRMETPVDPEIVEELVHKFPDFARAYNENGLADKDFDSFPPTVRTLRQFIDACQSLCAYIRNVTLPDPDKA